MNIIRRLPAACLFLALCLLVGSVRAQGLVEGIIAYGEVVEETIDETYIYDVWQFSGQAGDQIRAIMAASDGLMPLVGIRDAGGVVIERSEEGAPNGVAAFTFTLPTSGTYALVPTRAGLSDGTTTGGYRLALQWLNAPTPTPMSGDVTFRCGADEVTALASLAWSPAEVELSADYRPAYQVRVYSLDGLRPVVRVGGDLAAGAGCVQAGDAGALPLMDTLTLPGGETMQAGVESFSLTLDGALVNDGGEIVLTFGAAGGRRGRYLAVVGDFVVEPPDEGDNFRLLNAPLAAAAPLDLYMVAVGENNRLDPAVAYIPGAEALSGEPPVCDDAGRRPCADLPSAAALYILPSSGEGAVLIGSRFSAGWRLAAGELGWRALAARSFSGNTRGAYALVLVGALGESSSALE